MLKKKQIFVLNTNPLKTFLFIYFIFIVFVLMTKALISGSNLRHNITVVLIRVKVNFIVKKVKSLF